MLLGGARIFGMLPVLPSMQTPIIQQAVARTADVSISQHKANPLVTVSFM